MMFRRVLYILTASARAELDFCSAVAAVGFIIDLAFVDVVSAKHQFGVSLAAVDAVNILTKNTDFMVSKSYGFQYWGRHRFQGVLAQESTWNR